MVPIVLFLVETVTTHFKRKAASVQRIEEVIEPLSLLDSKQENVCVQVLDIYLHCHITISWAKGLLSIIALIHPEPIKTFLV